MHFYSVVAIIRVDELTASFYMLDTRLLIRLLPTGLFGQSACKYQSNVGQRQTAFTLVAQYSLGDSSKKSITLPKFVKSLKLDATRASLEGFSFFSALASTTKLWIT